MAIFTVWAKIHSSLYKGSWVGQHFCRENIFGCMVQSHVVWFYWCHILVALVCTLSLSPSSPGSGWTTKETVRSLAYSILADLVHHIRTSLSLQHLSMAVFLFSKNVHDETLPVSIQTMSCKLLLNLVECIRLKAENEPSVSNRTTCTCALVQFGCYQHRHEWKGLWCSSTARLLSTQT